MREYKKKFKNMVLNGIDKDFLIYAEEYASKRKHTPKKIKHSLFKECNYGVFLNTPKVFSEYENTQTKIKRICAKNYITPVELYSLLDKHRSAYLKRLINKNLQEGRFLFTNKVLRYIGLLPI